MAVYYTIPKLVSDKTLLIEGEEAHHINRVMRLKSGDFLEVVDGIGNGYRAEISSIKKGKVECKIHTRTRKLCEPDNYITLASGISTGSKFDDIIVRGTELGISRFIPILSDKGKIKKLDESSQKRRLTRWQKVAVAALKQSGRSVLPDILPPHEFGAIIEHLENLGDFMVFDPSGDLNINDFKSTDEISSYTIMIGPESGFAPDELEFARERNIPIYSFGKRILRTENAGPSIAAVLMYLLGELR